ncbi:MAG: nucleotidyltransferase family protein, partial [Nocardioidaceae bacterium]
MPTALDPERSPEDPASTSGHPAGVVLAAGEGRRMGVPKALVRDGTGTTWVVRTAEALRAGGCSPLLVVTGAAAEQVRAALAGQPVEIVSASDWTTGMAAS